MARRHRRRRDERPPPSGGGSPRVEQWRGEQWSVRQVTGAASTRVYRCPGCQQSIPTATPHVVVWPVEPSLLGAAAGETGMDERRHWHTSCWSRRR
jgi:hypothetical protein